ncbi:CBM_collapsed_G0036570.mRNA.1.CDS.1 [Saccharomyces cerevisiae]|nr:CBM_collapsed_G0036570.mRNA.1.CDS.1 [Saccharomyces cerevisiae]
MSQYESTPATPVTPTPGQCNMAQVVELPPHIQLWTDQDEWDAWKQRTDPVLHIELRRWADILVVAPLTANTLSKIALGLCDNLLTSVIRAWNPSYPILLAPSMVSSTFNSMMTKKQLQTIKEEMSWVTVFKPSEKVMDINGDIGLGVDTSDDSIEEEELIDEDGSGKSMITMITCGKSKTKKKKACKDCTCVVKFTEDELTEIDFTIDGKKVGGCGSCSLGDAFRCSGCPYLGLPAFKPGQPINLDSISDDL